MKRRRHLSEHSRLLNSSRFSRTKTSRKAEWKAPSIHNYDFFRCRQAARLNLQVPHAAACHYCRATGGPSTQFASHAPSTRSGCHRIIPEASQAAILSSVHDLRTARITMVRSLMVLRIRFAEDRLVEAAGRGVRQYVMIGAGLETFPWRQPSFAQSMQIFAVDHPATLAFTRDRLRKGGLSPPSNLTFVPLDLEQRQLGHSLVGCGFDGETAAFWSVLGVTQYLRSESLHALLAFAGSLPSGSEIVLSFNPFDDELDGDDLDEINRSMARGAAVGEPWITRMRPADLARQLACLGFSRVFHLTPLLAQERYFSNRSEHLRASRFEQLMAAVV
jgi:methyltransferase (TIGR00027 family)